MLFAFIANYYSLVFSLYFDPKYIIIAIILIFLEILSLGIHVLISENFENHKILYFALSSIGLSLIGLIFVSAFWIKSLLPIIFVSIFWIFTIVYYVLYLFISKKYFEKGDYYLYSTLIFNYGIFLGLIYGTEKALKFIYKKISENGNSKSKVKIFFILLIQYTIIIIVIWIEFSSTGSRRFEKGLFNIFFWISTISTFLICLFIFCYNKAKPSKSRVYYFSSIVYIPIMILYFNAFASYIEKDQILSFLFIIFFDLLSIVILILVFKTDHLALISVACIIPTIIAIICYHFCWFTKINDSKIITNISVISSFIIIYIVGSLAIIKYGICKDDSYYKDYFIYSVTFFDYALFGLTYAIIYFILSLICSCCCQGCQS